MDCGIVYMPFISFEDEVEFQISINPNLRLYFEDPKHQVHEDDTSIYSLDITDETLGRMEELTVSDDEKRLLKTIRENGYEYINVEPRSYFITNE